MTRWLLCLTVAVAIPAGAAGQPQAFPPPSLSNLQVLPGDSRPSEVIAAMRGFAQGLGVRCQHCHVGVEGEPLDTFDFVSDAKPAKATARAMMRLLAEINSRIDATVPNTAGQPRVACRTCHQGKPGAAGMP